MLEREGKIRKKGGQLGAKWEKTIGTVMGDRTRTPQKGEWCLGRGRGLQVGSSKSIVSSGGHLGLAGGGDW